MSEGARRLAEGWALELAETVADGVWGRALDGVVKARVMKQIEPRIEDAVRWIESLGE